MEGLPINHTPHAIVVYSGEKIIHTFPPIAPVLRLQEDDAFKWKFTALQTEGSSSIPVTGPPVYIGVSHAVNGNILVSQLVGQYLRDHPETKKDYAIGSVYVPDTGPGGVVRNDKGEIVGTKRLIKYA